MIETVLFDLDGTMLPMDQDTFTKEYFRHLVKRFSPLGYSSEELIAGVWKGTAAMVRNDGSASNYDVFWKCFADTFGEESLKNLDEFNDFYVREFENAKAVCGFDPEIARIVKQLKNKGISLVLASNPVFPLIAQKARMRWAGVDPDDFMYITSYENSHFCKPNPAYYREIADVLRLDPSRCLMVGNDVQEDMVSESAGMQVFLMTDCMINREKTEISRYPHGNSTALGEYLNVIIDG